MSEVEKYRKGLVCLVPKPGSDSVITSHEKTLCDCQVLEIFDALDAANAEIERLQMAITHSASYAQTMKEKAELYQSNWVEAKHEFGKSLQASRAKLATANALLDECVSEVPLEGEQADCRFCNYDNYIYKKHDEGCLGVRIEQARGEG